MKGIQSRVDILSHAGEFSNKVWREWASKSDKAPRTAHSTFPGLLGERLQSRVLVQLEGPEFCSRSNKRISTPDDVSIFVAAIVATPSVEEVPCSYSLSLPLLFHDDHSPVCWR